MIWKTWWTTCVRTYWSTSATWASTTLSATRWRSVSSPSSWWVWRRRSQAYANTSRPTRANPATNRPRTSNCPIHTFFFFLIQINRMSYSLTFVCLFLYLIMIVNPLCLLCCVCDFELFGLKRFLSTESTRLELVIRRCKRITGILIVLKKYTLFITLKIFEFLAQVLSAKKLYLIIWLFKVGNFTQTAPGVKWKQKNSRRTIGRRQTKHFKAAQRDWRHQTGSWAAATSSGCKFCLNHLFFRKKNLLVQETKN